MSTFPSLSRTGGRKKWAVGKKAVAICDRCGFKYLHKKLHKEPGTELMVCWQCNDGMWNRVTHPLNFPADTSEAVAIKDPRPDIIDPAPTNIRTPNGGFVLDNEGIPIFTTDQQVT